MKRTSIQSLVTLALSLAGPSPRRAFELAHRARRLLEIAAETASRNRWVTLDAPTGSVPRELEARFATECAAVIKYPVTGEAKVYAALLDAVDTARLVSDQLYEKWLDTQREVQPLPEPEPGINRIGAPLAPGCRVVEKLGDSDEEIAS